MSKKPDGKKKSEKVPAQKAKKVLVKVSGPKPDYTRRPAPTVDYATMNTVSVDRAYEKASLNYAAFADGVSGVYGFMSSDGKVVLEIANKTGGKPTIYVTGSTVNTVTPDDEWFLVHQCLHYETVRQIAGPALFAWQETLHSFLRPFVADLYKPKAVEVSKPVEPVKVLSKAEIKAAAKAALLFQQKKLASMELQKQHVALHHMEKNLITVLQAATGKFGYCDLSDSTGKLIALFGKEGNDRIVSVAYMEADHALRSAGVNVDDRVFGGYITHGMDEGHRVYMTSEKFAMRTALADYFRSHMEAFGIKFRNGKTANQDKFLKAA